MSAFLAIWARDFECSTGYCADAFDTRNRSLLSVCVVVLCWLGKVISSWSAFFAAWADVVRAVKASISEAKASEIEDFTAVIVFGFTRLLNGVVHLWHVLLLLWDVDG